MTDPKSAVSGQDTSFNASPPPQPAASKASPEMASPGAAIKKLSVLLPAALHRRAKRHALMHDKTLTTLIIELLSKTLDEAEGQSMQP